MHPSSRASMPMSGRRIGQVPLLSLILLVLIPVVSASISCVKPQGDTFKIGDPLIFDWGDDGTIPGRNNIHKITATIFCSSGPKILEVVLPNRPPFTGTVPDVGMATTAGGTQGPCPNNAFYTEYRGMADNGVHAIPTINFGPISCGSITIMPAPNNSFPITTIETTSSKTKTTTATATPTVPVTPVPIHSGIPTSVVIVIVVTIIVFLLMAGIGVAYYLRKKRLERMEGAAIPRKRQEVQEYPKGSSVEASRTDASDIGMYGTTAGAASSRARSSPQTPLPGQGTGTRYNNASSKDDDRYGRYQSTTTTVNRDDMDDEDNYYNQYYAQKAATAAAAALPRGTPSYYSGFSTSDYSGQSPFSDPYPHQQESRGYYSSRAGGNNAYARSSTTSLPMSSAMIVPPGSEAYASSALNILSSPSSGVTSGRSPQALIKKDPRALNEADSSHMHKVEARRP